jgi:hypothetical protein
MPTVTGFKGIDVRQSSVAGTAFVIRAILKNSTGAPVLSGTIRLRLFQMMSDGTIEQLDFSGTPAFKASSLTTAYEAMTYRAAPDGSALLGAWTYALSSGAIAALTNSGIYIAQVSDESASPTAVPAQQEREFQYGGDQGDLLVDSSGYLEVDAYQFAGQTITCAAGVTIYPAVGAAHEITVDGSGAVTFNNASIATVATVTNLTNAPTAGDLTATMKTSVQTASAAAITAAEPLTVNATELGGNSLVTVPVRPAAGFTLALTHNAGSAPAYAGTWAVGGVYQGYPYWTNGSFYAYWTGSAWQLNSTLGGIAINQPTASAPGTSFNDFAGDTWTASPGLSTITVLYTLPAMDPSDLPAGTAAIAAASLATSSQLSTLIGQPFTYDTSNLPYVDAGSTGGLTASQVWTYTSRTLTGAGGAIGPTAGANLALIPAQVVPQQTVDLSAAVYNAGALATQSSVSTIAYTIWDVEQDAAVTGQSSVSLTVDSVLWNTLQSDAEASNYNFRFRPNVALGQPFAHQGRFHVAVTFTPSGGGQAFYCSFNVMARW